MTDEEEFIDNHIKYIRRMAMLDDNSMRTLLRIKMAEDPSLVEKFREVKMKKQMNEIQAMAKDIKTQSIKLGRKVA